jgi:hypothetical protein
MDLHFWLGWIAGAIAVLGTQVLIWWILKVIQK